MTRTIQEKWPILLNNSLILIFKRINFKSTALNSKFPMFPIFLSFTIFFNNILIILFEVILPGEYKKRSIELLITLISLKTQNNII